MLYKTYSHTITRYFSLQDSAGGLYIPRDDCDINLFNFTTIFVSGIRNFIRTRLQIEITQSSPPLLFVHDCILKCSCVK